MAILSGEVKAGFSGPFTAGPHVQAGRLRAYAITGKRRLAGLPEVPTMAEAGVGDLVSSYWFGLLAPAGTPQTLVTSLNRQLSELLQSPKFRSMLRDRGTEPGEGTAKEFATFIRNETARFKQVFDAMGLNPQ